jgi:hypothetical protein
MEGFEQGLWVRVIAWPEDECFVLARREKGSKKPVPPSVVTLVRRGLPVLLRGTEMGYEDCTQYSYDTNDLGDGFGLFLRLAPQAAVEWWFSGVGKKGPDSCEWQAGKRYDNGSGEFHQLWNASPAEITRNMEQLRALLETGQPLPVNEALLTYRLADVVGLLVNPRSVKSIARAAGFLKGAMRRTEEEAGFYSYDSANGTVKRETLEQLKSAKHCRKFVRKVTIVIAACGLILTLCAVQRLCELLRDHHAL